MAGQEDKLTPVQERLLSHILDRALEPEPKGVPATECDAVVQDDTALLRHGLTYDDELLAFEGGLYFPTLRAMRRRGDAFAEVIAPLQGVLDFGRQILDDASRGPTSRTGPSQPHREGRRGDARHRSRRCDHAGPAHSRVAPLGEGRVRAAFLNAARARAPARQARSWRSGRGTRAAGGR